MGISFRAWRSCGLAQNPAHPMKWVLKKGFTPPILMTGRSGWRAL
jgi:hypothetical protein